MKFNKALYTLTAAALLLSMSSCKDFLDKIPDTRVEINSVEKARMLLTDAYPSYNIALPCELASDNIVDNNTANSQGIRYNLPSYAESDDEIFAFEDVKSGSGTDTPSGIWTGYYGAIANANAALECLDNLQAKINAGETVEGASSLAAVRGEALMIRAFGHYMLAQIFCMPYRGYELSKGIQGLPYITKPETTVKPHYDRMNLADYYVMIENDIKAGLPLIDNSIYTVPKYHFNKAASYAFAARFYLTKRDYRKVLDYCNEAFGGAEADASIYMSDLWNQTNFFYVKDISKYYCEMTRNHNLLIVPTYSAMCRRLNAGMRYAVNHDAMRSTVYGPGPTWSKIRYKDNISGEVFAMHPGFNGVCGSNGKPQYGAYFAGAAGEQFEYANKISQTGYAHVVRAEICGSEVIFMRAEAKLFLGDREGAIADLAIWEKSLRNCDEGRAAEEEGRFDDLTYNTIRSFYTNSDPGFGIVKPIHLDEVTPSDSYSVNDADLPVLQCIQHFRRIALVHTGMRFLDLKRYGIEWEHKIGKENRIERITLWDPRRAMQIPSEVLSAGFAPNYRTPVGSAPQMSVSSFQAVQ